MKNNSNLKSNDSGAKLENEEFIQIPEVFLKSESRKELIDYYKWNVNLATFVLTISLSLVTLTTKARAIQHKWFLIAGWAILCCSIFANWLLVKRFTILPIVLEMPEDQRTLWGKIFRISFVPNVKKYGFLQNWAFLIGILIIVISLILNLF